MAEPQPASAPEPLPAARDATSDSLSLGRLLSYAPPVMALSAPLFLVQFYFLNFATDVLLLAPIGVGLLFAAGRVWDAISDPIVGTWSDRTKTRFGRRRPWLLGGIPLLMLSLVMIWSPPALPNGWLYAWLALALFSFYSAFTMYSVPHTALGTELSTDHHERSRIFGSYAASFTIGMLLAFGGMQFVSNAESPREAASQLVFAAIFVLPLILLVPPVRLRERPEYQGRGAAGSVGAMRDVLRNPHARRVLGAQFVQLIGTGVLGIMAPYMMRYLLGRPDLIGPMPALFVVFSVMSIPVWVRISRRIGKRNVWMIGLVGTALSFGCILFVSQNDFIMMGAVLVFAGVFVGAGSMIGPSMLADVIDWDEHETGQRKEGAYAAAWGFAIKSATAFVILLASAALQLSDFTPNQEQTQGTLWMLRILNGGLPLVACLLGAWLLRGYTFDEHQHARVREALDRR